MSRTTTITSILCCIGIAIATVSLRAGTPGTGDAADTLQANTVWTGTISGDDRKPNQDHERGAVLRITSRDAEKFEGELVVRGNNLFALALDGRIKNGQVAAKVMRIIKGRWPNGTVDDMFTGTLNDDELVLKHANKQNLVSTISLKLDPDASSQTGGKKRKQK